MDVFHLSVCFGVVTFTPERRLRKIVSESIFFLTFAFCFAELSCFPNLIQSIAPESFTEGKALPAIMLVSCASAASSGSCYVITVSWHKLSWFSLRFSLLLPFIVEFK